jgi:hypothetical protein
MMAELSMGLMIMIAREVQRQVETVKGKKLQVHALGMSAR